MFKGYENIALPEYEVITPQTLLSFTVRSMTVQEEERLKSSLVTPTKITEHLNRCIYDLIVRKPEEIVDFKAFERLLTTKDREALLFGIYHTTYDELRNYDITCKECDKVYPVTVKATSTFNIELFPEGQKVLDVKVPIDLKILKGVKVTIKQPSLADEMDVLSAFSSSKNSEVVTDSIPVEKIEQIIPSKQGEKEKPPSVWTERHDIIDAIMAMPPSDRRLINKEYEDNFGKYSISLKMKSYCPFCRAEQDSNIDLVTQFFRMVYGSA